MPGTIIGSVRLTPAAAQPGEAVLVEALAPDGSPIDPAVPVVINGVRGARQFVQFVDSGEFSVQAVARQDGQVEQQVATVAIQSAVWPSVPAPAPDQSLALPADIQRLPVLTSARVPADRSPYRVQLSAADTDHFLGNLARVYESAASPGAAPAEALENALAVGSYEWDFGDGTTATTTAPVVDHDFFGSLSAEQEHHLFDVTCTLKTQAGSSFVVRRTMSVVNTYAICRNRGVVAPPVLSETHARKSMGSYEASLVVQNLEASPLTLNRRRFMYERGGTEVVTPFEDLSSPVSVPASSTAAIAVTVPFATVPADAHSFGVLYVGDDGQGRTVHVETNVDVALPDHRTRGLLYNRLAFTSLAAERFSKIADAVQHVGPAVENPGLHPAADPAAQAHSNPVDHVIFSQHVSIGALTHAIGVIQAVNAAPEAATPAMAGPQEAGGPVHVKGTPEGAPARFGMTAVEAATTLATAASAASASASSPVGLVLGSEPVTAALFGADGITAASVADIVGGGDASVVASRFTTLADAAAHIRVLSGQPVEGQPCDPDNRPDGIDDEWSCQINRVDGQDELITWHRHARFVNARKGDLLLAPGGPSGLIGGLLRQVSPPQHYAHIGMMTRNYDMVTHSTFSEDRLMAHPVGSVNIPLAGSEPAPTDGFEPAVLKYGWPGVITQWITGATDTGNLADLDHPSAPGDPERERPAVDPDGATWKITPFNKYAAIGDDFEIVPPLIVKPSPLEETPDVRAKLHQLADAALAATGKSHYRFFCYTDPVGGLEQVAPAEAGWAAGTFPSVCSSFAWVIMSRLGFQMEGPGGHVSGVDLEPPDVASGAEVTDGSRDGLYLYRADERKAAGEWLHERLRLKIMDELKAKTRAKVGGEGLATILADVIDLFSDIADDVANQMCNAFASDFTDTAAKDSDAWQNVGDSLAISPDNTLFWDPPSKGGLYGYAVPAAYSSARVEQAPNYVWRFVPNRGTLHGTVRMDGQPAGGALVQVADGLTTFTRPDGTYSLANVPFGAYELKALYDQGDGGPVPGQLRLDMQQVDQVTDIDLRRPQHWYRRVRVSGEFFFMKEYVIGSNPRTHDQYAFELPVTPDPGGRKVTYSIHDDFHSIYGVGNFLFKWENEGTINFEVTFAVAQDSGIIEDAADALSSAVDTISLGYVSSLFGSEVKGSDAFGAQIDPNGPAVDHTFQIGDADGTQGRLTIHVENLDL